MKRLEDWETITEREKGAWITIGSEMLTQLVLTALVPCTC